MAKEPTALWAAATGLLARGALEMCVFRPPYMVRHPSDSSICPCCILLISLYFPLMQRAERIHQPHLFNRLTFRFAQLGCAEYERQPLCP